MPITLCIGVWAIMMAEVSLLNAARPEVSNPPDKFVNQTYFILPFNDTHGAKP